MPKPLRIGVLAVAILAALAVAWAGWAARRKTADRSHAVAIEGLPRQDLNGPYLSSAACRECHSRQYDSWHASYHRKMTQPATPEAVQAPFDGEQFDLGEATARLSRRGDEFWVELDDRATGARRERRIIMTTGSHHMQGFWVARGSVSGGSVSGGSVSAGSGNWLDQLPLMWLAGDDHEPGRWVPIADSFLTPPGKQVDTPWNASCVFCHSVHGQPRLDVRGATADTTVAELGIACEACHGPGREHVESHKTGSQLPLLNAKADRGDESPATGADRSIIQPAHLPPERSAQVCGHCHSVAKFANDALLAEWYRRGSSFRPGDDLSLTRLTLLPARWSHEELADFKQSHAAFFDGNFWPDGMVRVAGREYNGLVESTCYQQGGMTCLSCHSLHESKPNDQLAAGMDGNQACYQCHDSYRKGLAAHTHHPANSSGSLCYNCHMPHTTYGLFKGIRSHQITSPNVAVTLATGRPNGCNLCHLDQTLQWTSDRLTDWYAQPPVELADDDRQFAAGALWLLRGDGVQRALTAYAASWSPARAASGDDWLPPLLARLLDDPYAAVRLVAYRSLNRLGWQTEYDFTGPTELRESAVRALVADWKRRANLRSREHGHRLLLDADGHLRDDLVNRLIGQRDDRPINIQE